ncbi:MAG: peptide chain release factor N(5)-glutamine methyltransferase [Tenericutes bacterium HGW-Tenericutes-4]|nr:MAG: peptide chain release factor N(5)-glutamine methyltransferase [Tenericutes bacterium HGW-Tenericutes-4]
MVNLLTLKNEIKKSYEQHNILEKSELDWLFCHTLSCTQTELFKTEKITNKKARQIKRIAKKRICGIPLDKIIKKAFFYGESFYVNNNVLTPRKETEHLVEAVINDNNKKQNLNILDLGTGSGIIAIMLKKHLNVSVTASDISFRALLVAKKNARMHKTPIQFVRSNLFNKIKQNNFDIIVSNPPYIKSSEIDSLQNEVKNCDPHLALDGGFTGLSFYKQIIRNAPQKLKKSGKLYFEVGAGQAQTIIKMLNKNFYNFEVIKDYNQIERVVIATKKGENI